MPAYCQLTIGCQNVRSAGCKSAEICDIIQSHDADILVVTETWQEPDDNAVINANTLDGYSCIHHRARPIEKKADTLSLSFENHGGIAIMHRSTISVVMLTLSLDVTTFEYICSRIRSDNGLMILVAVYRPGSKTIITQRFFSELTELLEHVAAHRCPVVLTGDFNVRVDRPDDLHASSLSELLSSFDLVQHVTVPTHDCKGMLDLVITRSIDKIDSISVDMNSLSDHALLLFVVELTVSSTCCVTTTLRSWKNFNQDLFDNDLIQSTLCLPHTELDSMSTDDVLDLYDSLLTSIINKHAPYMKKKLIARPMMPLFDTDCRAAKRCALRLSLRRRYYKSKLSSDCTLWITELRKTNKLFQTKSNCYWASMINNNTSNPKKLWNSFDAVLGRKNTSHAASLGFCSDDFQKFFKNKTDKVAEATATAFPPIIKKQPNQVLHLLRRLQFLK